MSKFRYFTSIWDTIKEVDLSPLKQQALHGIRIALVGSPGSGRSTLANRMRRDPGRSHLATDTPVLILDLDSAEQASNVDLIILMMDIRKTDSLREQELVRTWYNTGKRVIVFINQFETPEETISSTPKTSISPWASRGRRRVLWGSPLDDQFLTNKLAPMLIEMMPDQLLSLGRYFPLFRVPIARYLINDTCVSNAAYAMSSGLAEIVPVLNIPLVVADTVILTKNQAFLVYKLGLALGYSTRWQDYTVEFGGVLGSGLVWRQIAHTLVALIPVWGIVPKTTIAYAGTYVIGNVVLQWYLSGRHVSRKQMGQLYRRALRQGKDKARSLLSKLPFPRRLRFPRLRLPTRIPRLRSAPENRLACKQCGRSNESDASFCQYCGKPFEAGMLEGH